MISDQFLATLSGVEQDYIVDLYEVDVSHVIRDGSNYFYFCNHVNEKGENVVWNGQPYVPIPIKVEGMQLKSEGPSSRPTMTIANVNGYITGIINQFNGLIGAKLVRRRVPLQFLDAVNFYDGNKRANPNEYLLQVYTVNSAISYNREQATFELSLPSETDGALLPKRTIYSSVCVHQYRDECCGYTGRPVADINDIRTNDYSKDQCSKTLNGCKMRFGMNSQLPYGGFIMADKVG